MNRDILLTPSDMKRRRQFLAVVYFAIVVLAVFISLAAYLLDFPDDPAPGTYVDVKMEVGIEGAPIHVEACPPGFKWAYPNQDGTYRCLKVRP